MRGGSGFSNRSRLRCVRSYWRKDHEIHDAQEEAGEFCNARWARITARREGRAKDSTHARDTALCVGERQDRREQTVISQSLIRGCGEPLVVPDGRPLPAGMGWGGDIAAKAMDYFGSK